MVVQLSNSEHGGNCMIMGGKRTALLQSNVLGKTLLANCSRKSGASRSSEFRSFTSAPLASSCISSYSYWSTTLKETRLTRRTICQLLIYYMSISTNNIAERHGTLKEGYQDVVPLVDIPQRFCKIVVIFKRVRAKPLSSWQSRLAHLLDKKRSKKQAG